MSEYSDELVAALKDFYEKDDWKYDFDEDRGVFSMGLRLSGKINSARVIVPVHDDCFEVYAVISLSASEEVRHETAEFITRANYGLRNGCFEMDFNDGELRYKCHVDCEDAIPPGYTIIKNAMYIPGSMISRYGDGLVKVLFGMATASDAIDEIEG